LISFDEAPNIARALDKLRWATRIVVIDSGSTDGTLDIITKYPQAEAIYRPFTTFAEQCNYGLAQIKTEWCLSLDADYELSDEFVQELHQLDESPHIGGYQASFVYRIYGRPLRGTIYPPRTVLYRVNGATYISEGHGHRVSISGSVARLRGHIFHDDRKSLSRWFQSQSHYADAEAKYLASIDSKTLSQSDRIRRVGWPAPFLVALYVLFIKGSLLDGWAGWFYTLQRVIAESMLALAIVDRRLRKGDKND